MTHWFKRLAIGATLGALGVWANNSSLFVSPAPDASIKLLAHRGVQQLYAGDSRTSDTCKARNIAPPTHGYIENTLPSMKAAFAYGADIVELDVHLTPDGHFAVFHDWTLDCQTDGQGVTHTLPMTELEKLDVGFGYTADGTTFPLRGMGTGLMPTLQQVFDANLGGQYLINFKSKRAEEGRHLARMLQGTGNTRQIFGVYGGAPPTRAALANTRYLKGYDRASLKACLTRYALVGWSGHVPAPCRDTVLALPVDIAPYLWGWPDRFAKRMDGAGTKVLLLGPYDGSGFSSGIDDAATLSRLPPGFNGYIWTNRIEVIAPMVSDRRSKP